MKIKLHIFIISLLIFKLSHSYSGIEMTQLDNIMPSGLIMCDSLPTLSLSVKFPGVYTDSSTLFSTGFSKKPDNEEKTLPYPITSYDNRENLFSNFKPFLSGTKSFSGFSSGFYLGNFSTSSLTHNPLTIEDSIRSFNKNGTELNGAIWITSKSKYFKGLSLWTKQDYQNRTTHTATIDDLRKIHTHYKDKRKYAKGVLSGNFSFFNNQYSLIKLGYSYDHVTSIEERKDTLYFTNANFITSFEKMDDSFEKDQYDVEIGHIIKKKGYNFGFMAGGDLSLIEYVEENKDTSLLYLNCFFTQEINLNRLLLFTGVDLTISNTFYSELNSMDEYIRLITDFSVENNAKAVRAKIPLFGILSIKNNFKIMAGLDITYEYRKSYYNFDTYQTNRFKNSNLDLILYPLNIIFNPNQRTMISINPRIDKEVIAGSMQISFKL